MPYKNSEQVLQKSKAQRIIHHTSPEAQQKMATVEDGIDYIKSLHVRHGLDRKTTGQFLRLVTPVASSINDTNDIDEQMKGRGIAYDVMAQYSAKLADKLNGKASIEFSNAWMAANNESIYIDEEIEEAAEMIPNKQRKQESQEL